jgi:hypothetical protein
MTVAEIRRDTQNMAVDRLQTIIEALDCLEGKLHKQAAILTKASVACAFNETDSTVDVAVSERRLPPLVAQLRLKQNDGGAGKPRVEAATSQAQADGPNSSEPLRMRILELESELESQRQRHRDQLVAAEREIARLARARSRAASATEIDQQLIRDV